MVHTLSFFLSFSSFFCHFWRQIWVSFQASRLCFSVFRHFPLFPNVFSLCSPFLNFFVGYISSFLLYSLLHIPFLPFYLVPSSSTGHTSSAISLLFCSLSVPVSAFLLSFHFLFCPTSSFLLFFSSI